MKCLSADLFFDKPLSDGRKDRGIDPYSVKSQKSKEDKMPGISAAEWTYDAVNGVTRDLGLELADKVYKKE